MKIGAMGLLALLSMAIAGCKPEPPLPQESLKDQVIRLCSEQGQEQLFVPRGAFIVNDLVISPTADGIKAIGTASGVNASNTYFTARFECTLTRSAENQLTVKGFELPKLGTDSSRNPNASGEAKYVEDIHNGRAPVPPPSQ